MPHYPDERGRFGAGEGFGGRFVPETLMAPLAELEEAYAEQSRRADFAEEVAAALASWAGRPTPLTRADRLAERIAPGRGLGVLLKREDLAHTGAHKINNTVGQCLLARRMGKRRVIAETGAGQHGVATAAASARLGLSCRVYMGEVDMARQALNVYRMRLLGAEVVPVATGSRTVKDAITEAMRDWTANVRTTHYVLGSVLGPHPYPMMVRDFQSVIGREAKAQLAGKRPDVVVACVGGGSNAIGIFHGFLEDADVRLVGVVGGGRGVAKLGEHAARFAAGGGGSPGVLHGTRTYVLQDEQGQIAETHSGAAGHDYPAVGPAHAWLRSVGRAEYAAASDAEALAAFRLLSETEGIIPALERAHAVAWLAREGPRLREGSVVLVNLSGRGDKDVDHVRSLEGAGGAP